MDRVLVPAVPGALSALGLATAEPVATTSLSLLRRDRRLVDLDDVFQQLEARAGARLGQAVVQSTRLVDARYVGQSWEITVPWPIDGDLNRAFEAAHERHYGYTRPGVPVELVTLRVRVVGRPLAGLPPPPPLVSPSERSSPVCLGEGDRQRVPVRPRFSLAPGEAFPGPVILTQLDATVFVAPGWRAAVGAWGDLRLDRAPGAVPATR